MSRNINGQNISDRFENQTVVKTYPKTSGKSWDGMEEDPEPYNI